MMTKREIARTLEEIAFFLELKGENLFKVKAYTNAARVIEGLPEEPAVRVRAAQREQVRPALQQKVPVPRPVTRPPAQALPAHRWA